MRKGARRKKGGKRKIVLTSSKGGFSKKYEKVRNLRLPVVRYINFFFY